MPTYEYHCLKCGHSFECVHSMTAPALETCPKDQCPRPRWGKGKVKRGVGGGAGLIFKGSGFYITDYRSEGYKSAAKKDSTPASPAAGEAKGAAKSESGSKPASGGASAGAKKTP